LEIESQEEEESPAKSVKETPRGSPKGIYPEGYVNLK